MKKNNIFLILILVILISATLACNKTGQVVSVAEATAIAELLDEKTGLDTSYKNVEGAIFVADDIVVFFAGDDEEMVPLYKKPGDRNPYDEIKAGRSGKVDSSTIVDGVIWYKILSPVLNGYVTLDGLKDPSDGGEIIVYEVGDTPYLKGISYIVPLYKEPASLMSIIQQEKGVQVEILEVTDVDGILWYKINSPAGEGWITTENLSIEPIQ